jgi:hypothetical protein
LAFGSEKSRWNLCGVSSASYGAGAAWDGPVEGVWVMVAATGLGVKITGGKPSLKGVAVGKVGGTVSDVEVNMGLISRPDPKIGVMGLPTSEPRAER